MTVVHSHVLLKDMQVWRKPGGVYHRPQKYRNTKFIADRYYICKCKITKVALKILDMSGLLRKNYKNNSRTSELHILKFKTNTK